MSESATTPARPAPVRVSSRAKARKRALDILFESEVRGTDPLETLAARAADADPPLRDYTRTLVEGVSDHREAIDARISAALATGWTLPRTPRVDRSALRIAVLEIDHLEVPDAVAVAEAIRLVADLSTDESPSFVGGVLGTIIDTKPAGPAAEPSRPRRRKVPGTRRGTPEIVQDHPPGCCEGPTSPVRFGSCDANGQRGPGE